MSMKSAIHDTFTKDKKEDNPEELVQESGPPDGGFRAWRTVFGCFLMQFCGFGVRWIGALASFLAVIVTSISGPLYDRGWFYRLMIVGSLLQSLSLFALSFTKPGQFYLAFMVQGVVYGFGMGLTYAPSVAVVSQHFSSRKRTLVMSLVTCGSPLGGIIHPIMLNHLLNGAVGFEKGVRASAGFVSVLLLIACLSMRTRELPVSTVSYTVVARKFSRDVLFILMAAGGTLFQIGFYFPLFYLQLDSNKHGINVNFSFYSLSILSAASFIGRCTAGIIAAYAGVLNFTIASTLACSAVIISMMALSDMASVVVLGLAYGYFSGVYIALLVPLMAVLTPDLSELGARIGICFTFSSFGTLLGGPISGDFLGSQYKWWIASLFSGVIDLPYGKFDLRGDAPDYIPPRNKREPIATGDA
ncbi:major facilitator superfamily domain-containing protein [Suillus plorans]|uniref:Major facilitator superfamily domain-containing protein n=1 Tax=Suillus plorans TaxID=116603 RepID=A0A9P7AJ48_9AGAM|nr:major facilitator superfamily domain-containing protein [Suillus plorans]KAG1789940.1 major facilitator superfamily domain-containing protein [Suillus plorans]